MSTKQDFFLQWFLDSCSGCDHDLEDHERHGCTAKISGCGPGDNMDVWEYDCDCARFQVHEEIHWGDVEECHHGNGLRCVDCDAEVAAEEATW